MTKEANIKPHPALGLTLTPKPSSPTPSSQRPTLRSPAPSNSTLRRKSSQVSAQTKNSPCARDSRVFKSLLNVLAGPSVLRTESFECLTCLDLGLSCVAWLADCRDATVQPFSGRGRQPWSLLLSTAPQLWLAFHIEVRRSRRPILRHCALLSGCPFSMAAAVACLLFGRTCGEVVGAYSSDGGADACFYLHCRRSHVRSMSDF